VAADGPKELSMTLESSNQPEQSDLFSRGCRHESRDSWIGGAVLVGLGVVFLMQNLGFFTLENWWALFILIPAFSALGAAWTIYRSQGQFTSAMVGSLVMGGILVLVSLSFLFGVNINFGLIWPVFFILAGLSILLARVSERR
jgi:hypothetical protein